MADELHTTLSIENNVVTLPNEDLRVLVPLLNPSCLEKYLVREVFKIEKKSAKLFTLFFGGWRFEVIFTLFIFGLEWPNHNGLIRPEM